MSTGLDAVAGAAIGNPYNPFSLNTEFRVQVLDDGAFMQMRDGLKGDYKKAKLDNEMLVFEGCDRDDKIVLGGKNAFLSHFCTFFNFSLCSAPQDAKMMQRQIHRFNNADKLDKDIEGFMASFEDMK